MVNCLWVVVFSTFSFMLLHDFGLLLFLRVNHNYICLKIDLSNDIIDTARVKLFSVMFIFLHNAERNISTGHREATGLHLRHWRVEAGYRGVCFCGKQHLLLCLPGYTNAQKKKPWHTLNHFPVLIKFLQKCICCFFTFSRNYLKITTEKHRMSFPETVDEILDVSEDEGELKLKLLS